MTTWQAPQQTTPLPWRAGAEIAGTTYIKFRRKLITADTTFADACISNDQKFRLVYAYGQVAPALEHKPSSSLEIIPPASRSNKEFYKPDELKFHGGGVDSQGYDGRGSLGDVDLAGVAAAGSTCTPSTLTGFQCQENPIADLLVHFNPARPGGVRPLAFFVFVCLPVCLLRSKPLLYCLL
jgi:hypothetical protein